jgi:hypothetical protein
LTWWDYHLRKLNKRYLGGMVVMARQPYVGNLETIEKGIDICIIIIFSFEKK